MNIKNCPKCKKIFSPNGSQMICNDCIKKEEEEFNSVREYLRENRGAGIDEVSEATGVSPKKILKYLKDGKLEVTDGMSQFLKCEKCGKTIRTGQFCKQCSEKISNSLKSLIAVQDTPKNAGIKMHTRRN